MTRGWAGQEVTTTRCPLHPEDHSTQPCLPLPSDILPWVGLHCCPGNPCMVDPVVSGVGDALLLPQPGQSSGLTSL